MTVQIEDLLEGVKVSVTYTDDEGEQTKEGSVVAVNDSMLLIKPRGAMLGELIHRENIISLSELTEVSKLIVRKLRIVKPNEARQHLADRHGYPLESPYLESDMVAYRHHEEIDHSELSHIHEDKDDSERAEAIEAAQAGDTEGTDSE